MISLTPELAGDTVTWRSIVRTSHTVTFGPFPGGVPLPGNPAVAGVYLPADSYEGTGYWNSGTIGVDQPAGLEFTLKFTKPGTYRYYYCILHDKQGHVGAVTVAPRPPAPPATGTGLRRR